MDRRILAGLGLGVWLAVSLGCAGEDLTAPPDDPTPSEPASPPPPPIPQGDPVQGALAFADACASCHASRDGLDLVAFGYDGGTVLRRAVDHVDSTTARNILAHLSTLDPPPSPGALHPLTPSTRLFQPGDQILTGDRDLALHLFGTDDWPTDVTTEQLRAIDPHAIPIALPLPLWSDDTSNLDWMPDGALPETLLDANQGRARRHLDDYYETGAEGSLEQALVAIRVADRYPSGSACTNDTAPRYVECFDIRRWTATLTAQHVLRQAGTAANTYPRWITEPWWEVGQVSRRIVNAADSARGTGQEIALDNALANWVQWMYMGWLFDPGREPSPYLTRGLARAGLQRHAAYVALRSQVARAPGTERPYEDAVSVGRYAPDAWVADALAFAYRHLLERQQAGEPVPADEFDRARAWIVDGYEAAAARIAAEQAAELAGLRDRVLEGMRPTV